MIYYLFTTISLMFTKKVQVVSGSGSIIQDRIRGSGSIRNVYGFGNLPCRERLDVLYLCNQEKGVLMVYISVTRRRGLDGLYLCNQEKRPGWSISL